MLCGFGKGFRLCPLGASLVMREYGVLGRWYEPSGPCTTSEICFRILGTKSSMFLVGVGLRQGCPLSAFLFVIIMDWSLRCSQGEEGVRFGNFRIATLLFADDVVRASGIRMPTGHLLLKVFRARQTGRRPKTCWEFQEEL